MMGPGEDSFTPIAAMSISGEVSTISTSELMMSAVRFSMALPRLSSGMRRRLMSGSPFTMSTWGLEDIYLT